MSIDLGTIREQLAALVAMPSVSAVDDAFDMSNAAVVAELATWFEDRGLAIETQEVSSSPHKQNLVARSGDGDDGLVLSGHTDTVPYDAGRWEGDPFVLREDNGRWYGLGSADMKCFFPIVQAALDGFDPRDFRRPLVVLATADEESTMAGAMRVAETGRPLGRHAVIGEPTELVPIYKHKGIVIGQVEIEGRSGHSSDPSLGRNALDCMHDVMTALKAWREQAFATYRDDAFAVPGPTLNLGRISGGDSPNRICASCELLFDIRLMPGMPIEQCLAELQELVDEACRAAGTRGRLVTTLKPLPPMQTPLDSDIVATLADWSGNEPRTVAFATEGPFLNELGCESVIFGPGNIATAHQPNEYVEVARVEQMVDHVRRLIQRYCIDD